MSHRKNANDSPIKFYGYCVYPNCKHREMSESKPFVEWHGVHFSIKNVMDNLSPIGRLAEENNPDDYVAKYKHYVFNIELHSECAAEWGMHLIKDALNADYSLGSKLRKD